MYSLLEYEVRQRFFLVLFHTCEPEWRQQTALFSILHQRQWIQFLGRHFCGVVVVGLKGKAGHWPGDL